MMRGIFKKLLVTVLMFSLVFLNTIILQAAESPLFKNTIEVSGKATIKAKPTIAYIHATVKTENKDAKIAQEENAVFINQIKKAMADQYKLTNEDISTNHYMVRPSYDYVDGKQTFRQYITEHTLVVSVKNIAKVGEMIDTLVINGATSIQNIRFDILDSDVTYNLALQQAVMNAQSKANAITTMLGVKQGKPISIIEQSGSMGIIAKEMNQIAQDSGMMLDATTIEQSEIEVTAMVAVTFQY